MALASRMTARQLAIQSHRQPRLAEPVDHEATVLGPFVEHDVLDQLLHEMRDVGLLSIFVAQRPCRHAAREQLRGPAQCV